MFNIIANATYNFKATDVAGNVGTAEYTFGNIDTTAPEVPKTSADINELTNKDVTVTAMWGNGLAKDNWSLLGQLDANDWFVVGAGDYNGDQQDDLLVRQYSTGMLGYCASGDMSQWNVPGYGVDMSWTVIA